MQDAPWKKIFVLTVFFIAVAFASAKIFKKNDYRYELSVLAIFQNEDRFLKEWIDFYRVLGVDHFYLYNHLSDDNYQEVLQPYIHAGLVELFDWPFASQPGNEADWTRIQSSAYREGLKAAEGKSKWVAIVDTDEFLFPVKQQDLKTFIKDYENCSGVLVNWQVFGTSHVARVPEDKLMIETLLLQSPPDSEVNTFCKTIVRPEAVKACVDPHSVIYYPWSFGVDPDQRVFHWRFHKSHPIKIDKVRINHYWSRDEEFFNTNKLARYEYWGNKKQPCLERNKEANRVVNKEILAWVPKIYKLQNTIPKS